MANPKLVTHPLLAQHLTFLRSKDTPPPLFAWHLKEAGKILLLEALSCLPTKSTAVETPLTKTQGELLDRSIAFVAILRAGLGLTAGMQELLPQAPIGHIGLFRDEKTLKPVRYYTKLPKIATEALIILADPMLATGGSAVEAIGILKQQGFKDIVMLALVAAKKGIRVLQEAHPDVLLYVAAIDPDLNNLGFIVPGLGDCGDRLFGT